jgi:Fic family protein
LLNSLIDVTAMEPMLVPEGDAGLDDLTFDLNRRTAALAASMHPAIQKEVGRLIRSVNCYYSNSISGSLTPPPDIERALRKEFATDQGRRALQYEALAHVQVQQLIDVGTDPRDLWPASDDYVRWLHRELFSRLPAEMLVTPKNREIRVVPGEYRTGDVDLRSHKPPSHSVVPDFMRRFAEAYRPDRLSKSRQLTSIAAAHHHLMWIHPFADGNGRVARLMSHAMLHRLFGGYSLWSVARGLARNAERYKACLAAADIPQRNSLDGRDSLSLEALKALCIFFLSAALDEVDFMHKLLQPHELLRRMEIHVGEEVMAKRLPKGSFEMLREAFYRGSIQRADAKSITGHEERRARETLSTLLVRGLLVSTGPRAPVSLGFPTAVLDRWLPDLYPMGLASGNGA